MATTLYSFQADLTQLLKLNTELQTISHKFTKLLSSDLAIAKITKKLEKLKEDRSNLEDVLTILTEACDE